MGGKDLEMVLLTEKGRQVGGERVDELLPLRPIMRFQPPEVIAEARMPRLAQPPRKAAVDHGMLAVMQADARALVNQRLHPRKVGGSPDEFAPMGQGPRDGIGIIVGAGGGEVLAHDGVYVSLPPQPSPCRR